MLGINYKHPIVETLWTICKFSVVLLESLYTQYLSGPPEKMVENQHTIKWWVWLFTNCCTSFLQLSLHICISIKSSIGLGSRPRTVVCKKKMVSVEYIYIKKNRCNKKINVIKNHSINFTCETNRTESMVFMVKEPWTRRFIFSVPNCDYHMKCIEVPRWMYYVHTGSETYDGLKSFHTTMSFQPRSFFSFEYFLTFFCASYKKSCNLYGTN